MAVNYPVFICSARLQVVLDALGPGAVLVIGTDALFGATGVLATFPLPDVPGHVQGKVLALAGLPKNAIAAASGTATRAELRDAKGNAIVSGLTVGLSGTDVMIIPTVAIDHYSTTTLFSGTITHA